MARKKLMKGNVALCYGAIAARCDAFFGYPITPQNEVPEKMSELMPANGKVFLQAESELAAINMVYGAAAAGARAMTSSSSPGISLKLEGLSYIAGSELPCVVVNVQRGGPGLGNTLPGQADYFQAVKGGGHGDYHLLTIAPWSVQECYDFMPLAFDLADRYRNPVMILMDAIVGQMLEPVDMRDDLAVQEYQKPWATNGARGRAHNVVNSLWVDVAVMERLNDRLQAKYSAARQHEVRLAEYETEDADLVLIAYGSPARICRSAIDMAREDGIRVGLLRPISLYPFPEARIGQLAATGKRFLVVEMSAGQMVEDVRLAVCGRAEVAFYGRTGGAVPTPTEILNRIREAFGKPPVVTRYPSAIESPAKEA
jgi:2-oxoglutarate ferredoxin oxidoreductase subunit alpha